MSWRQGFHENHNLNVFWWVGGVGGFEFFWKPNGIQGARRLSVKSSNLEHGTMGNSYKKKT